MRTFAGLLLSAICGVSCLAGSAEAVTPDRTAAAMQLLPSSQLENTTAPTAEPQSVVAETEVASLLQLTTAVAHRQPYLTTFANELLASEKLAAASLAASTVGDDLFIARTVNPVLLARLRLLIFFLKNRNGGGAASPSDDDDGPSSDDDD